jgi:hypothetical protein
MSPVLRSVGFLDALSSTPAESSRRASVSEAAYPCPSVPPRYETRREMRARSVGDIQMADQSIEFLLNAAVIAYHPSSVDARIIVLKSVA